MNIDKTPSSYTDIFRKRYGTATIQVSAPGRANIIGEHTDYNQGYVLPFAIDKYLHFAAAKSDRKSSRVYAANLDIEIDLGDHSNQNGFGDFLKACIFQVSKKYTLPTSFDLVFGGDLPIGAGMSSSSALCCGFVYTLSQLYDLHLAADEILHLVLLAERGVSVEGGIMDQFTIINGREKHAILLDCQSNDTEYIPFDLGEYAFCLIDSGVSHNLGDTAYDKRVSTCRTSLEKIKKANTRVHDFRDITKDDLKHLSPIERNRMQHVLDENERVLKVVQYLNDNNLVALGLSLNQSHSSLRDLYEVSCKELDLIVSLLQKEQGVLGARMMGGGFGGSVITLIKAEDIDIIMPRIAQVYEDTCGIALRYYKTKASKGLI